MALVSSRLDYCNSLLCGLPGILLHKLQSVQNATARLITGTRRRDHITPVLRELHWLPIRERVKFKVFGQAPLYLADDCCLVSDRSRRSLRSTDIPTCVVPRTLSSYGDRTFAAAGLRLWIILSFGPAAQSRHHLRTVQTTPEGTHFSASINATLYDMRRLRKALTYLLTCLLRQFLTTVVRLFRTASLTRTASRYEITSERTSFLLQ